MTTTCPLCPPNLQQHEIQLENRFCLFVQQPQPVLIGSGLIIPREHRETAFDLNEAEWLATFDLLQQVKVNLDKELNPQGYNIGWNCGQVGGQEIFHAHLHLIPRFRDEPFAGRGIRFWLKQAHNRRSGV
jgi:diadenosine tetraphosphate (Ap4A) HIT family hydrolase